MKARRRPPASYRLLGTLPPGHWVFGLVLIQGQKDAIVVVDRTGDNVPRMIINGKMEILE
jgi:hypothetical protein